MTDKFRPTPNYGAYRPSSYERDEWQATLARLKEPTVTPNQYRAISWVMGCFVVANLVAMFGWFADRQFAYALAHFAFGGLSWMWARYFDEQAKK